MQYPATLAAGAVAACLLLTACTMKKSEFARETGSDTALEEVETIKAYPEAAPATKPMAETPSEGDALPPAPEPVRRTESFAKSAPAPMFPSPSPKSAARLPGRPHERRQDLRDRDSERYPGSCHRCPAAPAPGSEEYAAIYENDFRDALTEPLSTFSIDVDGASYANARRFLREGSLPPPDAVRIEEFINYFDYGYSRPSGQDPFSITTEAAETPWNPGTRLVHIGLQARRLPAENLPPNNLVFLIDVSGSMGSEDKLPLLKNAFGLLVDQLRPRDRVSLVVYAGAAGMVLPPTSGAEKETIRAALDRLEAGGSTAGGAGLLLAYQAARDAYIAGGNNRVILATDGDFNVGVSGDRELVRLIEGKRKSGIFLSVLGFGTGNYKDAKMEQVADKGNGNYFYIDGIDEARKVLVEKLAGTLHVVAKDVKMQVEFNPAAVKSYRLIGYENRSLAAEDFNDDGKDAGELGAGSNVTALYEIVPAAPARPRVDPLKYQPEAQVRRNRSPGRDVAAAELLTVKIRYQRPDGGASRLLTRALRGGDGAWQDASENFRFSAAVAGFGMALRGSKHAGDLDFGKVAGMARGARGRDLQGRRAEFIELVEAARALSGGDRYGDAAYP